MELHAQVAQFYDEIRVNNEFTTRVRVDSALVCPLLRLVIDGKKVNSFVRLPPGTAENDRVIR
jgi:hypothetical protein